jgi:hypothetical protein
MMPLVSVVSERHPDLKIESRGLREHSFFGFSLFKLAGWTGVPPSHVAVSGREGSFCALYLRGQLSVDKRRGCVEASMCKVFVHFGARLPDSSASGDSGEYDRAMNVLSDHGIRF